MHGRCMIVSQWLPGAYCICNVDLHMKTYSRRKPRGSWSHIYRECVTSVDAGAKIAVFQRGVRPALRISVVIMHSTEGKEGGDVDHH